MFLFDYFALENTRSPHETSSLNSKILKTYIKQSFLYSFFFNNTRKEFNYILLKCFCSIVFCSLSLIISSDMAKRVIFIYFRKNLFFQSSRFHRIKSQSRKKCAFLKESGLFFSLVVLFRFSLSL